LDSRSPSTGLLSTLFKEWRIATISIPRIETASSLLSLLFWLTLVIIGFTGARDPLANPLPLTVWTLLWTGFTFLCALLGNLWAILNPWTGLAQLIGADKAPFSLPTQLGYAPALIGLLAFGWFEIVDLAPDDPARLAQAVAGYWLITLLGIMAFGERAWMQRGDQPARIPWPLSRRRGEHLRPPRGLRHLDPRLCP